MLVDDLPMTERVDLESLCPLLDCFSLLIAVSGWILKNATLLKRINLARLLSLQDARLAQPQHELFDEEDEEEAAGNEKRCQRELHVYVKTLQSFVDLQETSAGHRESNAAFLVRFSAIYGITIVALYPCSSASQRLMLT